ncbi:MAG: BREX-1 system phosphatase PglZ type A [Peptococcaceae bacterium]|jgi:uncharacterized protein (TIGR02687 family)|nr:BREX-1 system phosphatase PglZ type A [Peptococcaceae bacterium]
MNITEIKKSLDRMFAAPLRQGAARNIIFWYDESGAFADKIDGLNLAGAKTVKLCDNNVFATKLYIEREDTQSNLLIYSPFPRPANKENWLTDAIKYGQTFLTDEASLILLNYKMAGSLRPLAEIYKAFFRSAGRCRRFDGYGITEFTEKSLDIAILSALCKLPAPNFDACIREILCGVAEGDASLIETVGKFGSLDRLWLLIEEAYGYRFPDKDFEKLAILLLVTHLSQSIDKLPSAWSAYKSENTNGFVFVDGFMKMKGYTEKYKALADLVSDRLQLPKQLAKWKIDDIIGCDTFRQFDTAVAGQLLSLILDQAGEYGMYKKAIRSRRGRRWFSDCETEYSTLLYACEFLSLAKRYGDFSAASREELWKLYEDGLYKFDTFYRKFTRSFDSLHNPEDYRALADKIEQTYTNGFLRKLSAQWRELPENGKAENGAADWGAAGAVGQERFYESKVKPFIDKDERIIVIISDALRYEAAAELLEVMKREHKGTSELSALLSVVSSRAKPGMAALLPRKPIEIKDGGCWIDGADKILKAYKSASVATTYEKLAAMSKREMSALLSGIKVAYIYHSAAATERDVSGAAEKTIRELTGLVRTLKNNVSAINFFITAGANCVHGGATLQEVMLPLIRYRSGKNIAKAAAARKVNLHLTSISRKVTNAIIRLSFFQKEQVADKLLPLRVQAYFEDENGGRVSNENIIIADSASPNPEERTYKESFTLRNIPYDKAKTYYLVLKDSDTADKELERIPFTIDLVCENENLT